MFAVALVYFQLIIYQGLYSVYVNKTLPRLLRILLLMLKVLYSWICVPFFFRDILLMETGFLTILVSPLNIFKSKDNK